MRNQTTARAVQSLILLVLLAASATACGPATPQPTVTPAPPTATPQPFPPPRLLSRRPAVGEEQLLDASVELTFDQPMDRASVEAAFTISPSVAGRFSWSDERTVAFAAETALRRGESYQVTLAATARNAEGKTMEDPAEFSFSTVGFLRVSQVQPPPGTEDVSPDSVITVVFNRPVVPLTAVAAQAELPQPLTLTPPVEGQGEWLNTSIYVFRPAQGLLPATGYTARVDAGLSDTTGGVMEDEYSWSFSTLRPAILSLSPGENDRYVGPSDVISVTFNQPMNHASAEEHLTLRSDRGETVAGTFRWSGGETPSSVETMAFVPDEPLPRGVSYDVLVRAGALAQTEGASLSEGKTWRFQTVNEPGLISSRPTDGQENWWVYEDVSFVFASPMDTKAFTDYLRIEPSIPITDVYTYWSEYDTQVQIGFPKEPASPYSITLSADTPDKHGAPLGIGVLIRFTTGDLPPAAQLDTGSQLGTISAYTDTIIYATYQNVSRLDLELYRLSPNEFMQLNGFGSWDAWSQFSPDPGSLVRRWSPEVTPPRNEMVRYRFDLTRVDDSPLAPGLYYVQLTAPEVTKVYPWAEPSRYMFVRTRVNLTLKQSRSEVLVWATDQASGEAIGDLAITLYSEPGQGNAQGRTDADGLLIQGMTVESVWNPFFALTGQPGDEGFALAFNGWDSGVNPWDFSVESEFWSSPYVGYLYTDRPIYRPGQVVYFKGIVRADDDAVYSVPQFVRNIDLRISDPNGKELYKQAMSLNDLGTLHGEFTLDQEAVLGTYYLEMFNYDIGLFSSIPFQVAEYRKPEYQVAVATDRDAYLSGEMVNVTTEGTYYFGGPVAQADVRWSVLSDDYWFVYQCPLGETCPWYDWIDYEWGGLYREEDYGAYGELIAQGDTKLDNQGRATFAVPADITERNTSQRFTIEASVTDINGQEVSNRTATVIHKAQFYIGLAPRGYVSAAGEEMTVDLITVDWDSQPVADVPLTVIFMEHRWYSVRQQHADGYYYWDWIAEDLPIFTTTVTTGSSGKAEAAFTPPEAGAYRVRAIGRDGRENEVRSSTYLWVWGGGYVPWRQESNNRITLIADKKEYEVGDVAEILIPSPYSGTVRALITFERGQILHGEVRELTSNSEVLRVPITEDHVPNIFLSVVIVQGSEQAADGLATFKMGLIKLPVSIADKELTITLTPDKDMAQGEYYGPRETATYDLLVTDRAGNPVEAELSLRLADLAVLALADEFGPTLLETFWSGRGLGVRTSTPLSVSLEQFNLERAPGKKGGGGGDEAREGLVRTQFADTAFWDPVVRTDEEGRAQVRVVLPDNLTTWRMQARGITSDTRVGRAEIDVLSTLDLLVRPVLPRFFVAGDRAEIATIVHNNTGEALRVEVDLMVEGLLLEGPYSQEVEIPAGEKAKVVWPVTAQAADEVRVHMSARAGDLFDGREDTLPVYHYATPEVVATAGRLSEPGERQEVIQLPRVLDPTQGELTVQLDGSLTAATRDGLTYLEHYPYECTEQTVSRFLPNVLSYQALQEMGLADPALEQKLADMVAIGLQRLYSHQHYDGGWGWWVDDKSDSYMTAYVLHGLLEARRTGFVVDREVMERAAGYLRENLPRASRLESNWQANRLAYALYVLAEYGQAFDQEGNGDLGLAIGLFEKRHLLSRYGQATLALALGLLEPEEPTRRQTLLSDLAGEAIYSATGTHWEEAEADYWNMNTDIRTTAIVLWAAARLEPESELLPNVVRWLMAARKEGHWETTQDTAWSLIALVAYMRASGELTGDFSYAVYLNGQSLSSGSFSQDNLTESHELQVEIAQLLRDEANRLVIERSPPTGGQGGEGQLYYAAYLRYFLPADQVQALARGIVVGRQYSPVDRPGTHVDGAQVGDVLQVKLTLVVPNDLYYVVVEDPLPAGCEGVDQSLKTTSVVGQAPELRNLSAEEEDTWYRRYGWGWWWFSHTEMRDEKVVLFATYLPRGTYEYTYLMRASVPGEFLVIPAHAYQMYFPEVFGRSDGGRFVVEGE